MICLKAKHHGMVWVAARIYDRTLAAWLARDANTSKKRLGVLVGVCVMLSSKLHDAVHAHASDIADWVESDPRTVVVMEAEVLGDLGWMVCSTPPHAYLGSEQKKALRILDAVACDSALVRFPSHQVAEAAVAVAADDKQAGSEVVDIVRDLAMAAAANPKTPLVTTTAKKVVDTSEAVYVTPKNQPIRPIAERQRKRDFTQV